MAYVRFGKSSTLAQAKASDNENKIFFPTDGTSIVLGGKEFGKQPTDYQVNYEKTYLTFEAIESGTFQFTINALQYSIDNGTTWTTLAAGTASPTVSAGSKILWKQTGLTPSSSGIGTFSATGNFEVYGNVMSLYYGDNFIGQTSLSGKNDAFVTLFYNNTKLIDASNLILPATTLANSCYASMFRGCTSLTTAPELPATTLANNCYNYMFRDCTALITAPELPVTTLANNCCKEMFSGCTSLTTAPSVLPATTLASTCYTGMFYQCTSLTTAPELPATTLAYGCYQSMFNGCTSLTTAPELPATSLAQECYMGMFSRCTALNYIKCLATDISASDCTTNWVRNITSSGTFVKASTMNSWATGSSGIPLGWTVYTEAEYEVARKKDIPTENSLGLSIDREVIAEAIAQLSAKIDNLEALHKKYQLTAELDKVDALEYYEMKAPKVLISTTAGAPSAGNIPNNWNKDVSGVWAGTPYCVGQIYVDQPNSKVYMAKSVTNSTGDWVALN